MIGPGLGRAFQSISQIGKLRHRKKWILLVGSDNEPLRGRVLKCKMKYIIDSYSLALGTVVI